MCKWYNIFKVLIFLIYAILSITICINYPVTKLTMDILFSIGLAYVLFFFIIELYKFFKIIRTNIKIIKEYNKDNNG